jgi:hypothetical protein
VSASDSITDASGDTHTGELADKDGDDLTPNTIDVATSITDPEDNTVTSLSGPVRVTEEASTFTEGDVTVTHNGTVVSNESLELGQTIGEGATASRPVDNDSYTAPQKKGLLINPNVDLEGVKGTISSLASGFSTAYLIEHSTGSQLDSTDISSLSAGDVFELSASLSANVEYRVDIDNNGSDYTIGRYDSPSYPYTSSDVDITAATSAGTTNDTNANNIADITAVKQIDVTSGNALVEWDSGSPSDIDSWDLATFQETLDGETVTVDVEDSTGTVLKSDISKDTDISDIPTSTDVKFRANLSRSDTANNPSVDYLARRFTR